LNDYFSLIFHIKGLPVSLYQSHGSRFDVGADDNNFKLLRFLTALTVAATHCLWVIYGIKPPAEWPIGILIQISHCGICIFFGLSGYLITASLMDRPKLFSYAISRLVRLCPLLFVAALFMAFVAGPLVSTASFDNYYGDWRLWAYVPLTTFAYPDMTLPGVFTSAPAASEVNISIWTLRYEMIAYLLMGIAAGLGVLRSRYLWVWIGCALVGYCVLSFATNLRSETDFLMHGARFGFAFIVGLTLFAYRQKLLLTIWGVGIVIGLAVLTNHTAYMEPFRILALTYSAVWFGLRPDGFIRQFNKLGDYSYGIFVFHWPIAQIVLQYNPGIDYVSLLGFVIPLSLACAVLSWHAIEAPLLQVKVPLAGWAQQGLKKFYSFGQEGIEVMGRYEDRPNHTDLNRNNEPLDYQEPSAAQRHFATRYQR